ncbi:NUDIX hydrolase [Paucibacter sp. KBW04]|uniref:NUDIX domain-containing protein n=1 Tax=Paucibacter sp. KBW04 TaxID=2153361 RepID=UPI000F58A19E|nr:NUDIX hydrolase [Paucibacter sp. KBW04]RQO57279.1 NUDIX hydrolase [Paucibacter sp. KBW04]
MQTIKHRIAAGVIVEHEGRILLVRHQKPGAYDFWVAPGGGAEDGEDLLATVRREALEETGLQIEPTQLVYVEEFCQPQQRECKMWFLGRYVGGQISTQQVEATREHIVEAAWLHRDELAGKTVFPPVLHTQYWEDKKRGFDSSPRYLGLRVMEFF